MARRSPVIRHPSPAIRPFRLPSPFSFSLVLFVFLRPFPFSSVLFVRPFRPSFSSVLFVRPFRPSFSSVLFVFLPPSPSPARAARMSSRRQTQSYLRNLFARRGIAPQHRYGQNFLIDLNLHEL